MIRSRASLSSLLLVVAFGCGDDSGGGSAGSTSSDEPTSSSSSPSTTATPTTTTPSTSSTGEPESTSSSGEPTDTSGSSGETTGGDEPAELWTFTHNGDDSEGDEVRGVAVDGEGNVYAAGQETAGGTTHAWVIRLDPEGNETWTFAGTEEGSANAIALLPGGDVVIAGSVAVMDQGLDATVTRLSGDAGAEAWTETYDGVASADDEAFGIAVDGAGDIVVVGQQDAAPAGLDAWIRKYDASGAEQWTTPHAGDAGVDDSATAVAIDSSDNIVVVGFLDAGTTDATGFVARYGSGGAEDWFTTITVDTFQVLRGVAVDADDNALVGGRVGDETLSIFVGKYDSAGAEVWTAMHLQGSGPDYARAAAVDASGNAYFAGYVNVAGQFLDVWGRKYAPDGTEGWSIAYANMDAALDDTANAIAVDADGNVIVAGFETVFLESRNAWIRKYSQ